MKTQYLGTYYTILLVITALLGEQIVSISIGPQLSPFRIVLLFAPIVILKEKQNYSVIKRRESYPYVAFLLFWVLYSLLLLPLLNDYSAFGQYLYFLVSALITSVFVSKYICSKESFFKIFSLFEWVALFMALIGLYEIVTGDYHFVNENSLDYYESRSELNSTLGIRVPISAFGNPNDFSLFLLFSICISNMLSHIKKSKVGRLLSSILSIFLVIMVVSTQSRAAFISMLLFLVLLFVDSYNHLKKRTKVFLILSLVASSSYIVSWIADNQELYEALITIDLNASEGSDYMRINLIRNGFVFLLNSGFMGVGLGNIEYHMAHSALYDTEGILNIHNWWMEILVSSGLMVFIWYVSLYVTKLFRSFKAMRQTDYNDVLHFYYRCILSLLFVFILGSTSSSSNFTKEWQWAMFAVVFAFPTKIIRHE